MHAPCSLSASGAQGASRHCQEICPGWFMGVDNLKHYCNGGLVGDPHREESSFDAIKNEQPNTDNRRVIPTPDEFLPYIEGALRAVLARLTHAGEAYGEEVLFLLDEVGAVSQCFTKASRALWSLKQGQPPEKRKDSWMDLAGYAILEMARIAYASGMEPSVIDGLFDRSGKK